MPPNSPESRENPAPWTESRHTILGFPKRRGGDSNPRYRLHGTTVFEEFRTFYWPTLRALIIGLIEEGMIRLCFAEGRYNTRLETIMDLPKGKTAWLFDQIDMAWAKQTIGTVACIEGNMPLSLLHAGTPEEVADHTRRLIDVAGAGGGFILDIGGTADEGSDENLHAMIETAKEYGVY